MLACLKHTIFVFECELKHALGCLWCIDKLLQCCLVLACTPSKPCFSVVITSTTKSGRPRRADSSCTTCASPSGNRGDEERKCVHTNAAVAVSLASSTEDTTDPIRAALVRSSFAGSRESCSMRGQISAMREGCELLRHSLMIPTASLARSSDFWLEGAIRNES